MRIRGGLGVQSYCYRGFKSGEELTGKLKETGMSTIELCAVHQDFDDESGFEAAIAAYRDAGIRIVSIGVEAISDDALTVEKRFAFCRAAGAKHMSVDFKLGAVPDCYRLAEKMADKYDVRVGIHNHGGPHWLGSAAMLEHVFGSTGERIGLNLDTAWALDSREDPVKMVERFGSRLYCLHLKDFVFGRDGKHEDVVAGKGNLDLPALKRALEAVDFDGFAVVEYEADVEDPVPALKDCVMRVREGMDDG